MADNISVKEMMQKMQKQFDRMEAENKELRESISELQDKGKDSEKKIDELKAENEELNASVKRHDEMLGIKPVSILKEAAAGAVIGGVIGGVINAICAAIGGSLFIASSGTLFVMTGQGVLVALTLGGAVVGVVAGAVIVAGLAAFAAYYGFSFIEAIRKAHREDVDRLQKKLKQLKSTLPKDHQQILENVHYFVSSNHAIQAS